MLKMNWMTDNEGRLVATWSEVNQPAVTPSYLREEPTLEIVQAAGPATGKAFLERAARKYHNLINHLMHPGGGNSSSGLLAGPKTL
jgi:hypothetical protein